MEVGQSVEAGEELAESSSRQGYGRLPPGTDGMGTWEFGFTVALVGSVGTLLVLWLLSLLIILIRKIFPS